MNQLYRIHYAECLPRDYEEGETPVLTMIAECVGDAHKAAVFWGETMEYNVLEVEPIEKNYPIDMRLYEEDFDLFQPPDQRINTLEKEKTCIQDSTQV